MVSGRRPSEYTEDPPGPDERGDSRTGSFTDRELENRLTKLETNQEHLASKTDIEKVKVHMLASLVGAGVSLITAVAIVVTRFWPTGGSAP